ncbi:helix-turn-helix transcriptional regulator [Thorsellia anophelis]|uniref:Helix-turn-helix n=1 Tax=Thorsellia anophelis DSM 18579 TaxID=1123402 RepID=A0A1H9Z8Z7_9GAMM|nr:helix-turn-helix transcriptional regulator [Thorsellia anophelis]SES77992.1 Helix-turn-helix [Thorsellia anophelis DSM 18579]
MKQNKEMIKGNAKKVQAQRVSKHLQPTEDIDRHTEILNVMHDLLLGRLTQGQALKVLRIHIAGLKQAEYVKLVKVSRKTISDIENDRSCFNTDILDKVFKPFGIKVGLVPINSKVIQSLMQP